MKKLKRWLYHKFLPAWCREELLDTNRRLLETVSELREENRRLNAYISGMETAMRGQRRIVIRNGVKQ